MFSLYISSKNIITFTFSISLHVDDIRALNYIQRRLNCGNVYVTGNISSFNLRKLGDIKSNLLPVLEKFPLNGAKYLDYLVFKEAIGIKSDPALSDSQKSELINCLKNQMN